MLLRWHRRECDFTNHPMIRTLSSSHDISVISRLLLLLLLLCRPGLRSLSFRTFLPILPRSSRPITPRPQRIKSVYVDMGVLGMGLAFGWCGYGDDYCGYYQFVPEPTASPTVTGQPSFTAKPTTSNDDEETI
jgi:hypothetical protein